MKYKFMFTHTLKLSPYGRFFFFGLRPQNSCTEVGRSHCGIKYYFELGAFVFLKSLICLKAEPPRRAQLSKILSLRATLISSWRKVGTTPHRHCPKLSYLSSGRLRSQLFFQAAICFSMGALSLTSKKSCVLPEASSAPSPAPIPLICKFLL